ncbi:MAG: P1 family peptidase, partial [bacterium]
MRITAVASLTFLLLGFTSTAPAQKPRARTLGVPFDGKPGPWNAITDVQGVEVGETTLISGDSVRTGVTAVLPRGKRS